MRAAAAVTVAGHVAAMRATRPGMREYEAQAALEAEFRRHGSPRNGYPSIVASGPNACVLHYRANADTLVDGDLLLVDAGADAVFGHGPHRVQPLEFYNDRPIFWSLGNFVWHNLTRQTAVAEVLVARDGTISASLIPGTIVSKGHPVLD